MAGFGTFIERVLAHEAGFVDHPSDPGGATNLGITERVAREHGYKGAMRNLPRATAVAIYRQSYWAKVKGDALPPALAFQVFDAAVNHGTGNAIRWLQRALGVADDGILGPITLGQANATPLAPLVFRYIAIRTRFYTDLSTFGAFGKGWTRRIAENLRFAAEDLPA